MPLINPKKSQVELTTPEIKNPNFELISKSPPLHKYPRHTSIIPLTSEINVINANKNHPTSISQLLSRVGASVAPSQDNINLLLCQHLNKSSFHSFNSSL